jgi:Tfp pilus assembly protein PilE
MAQKSASKGFTAVEAIIVILVVAVLAFGGWFIWHKSYKKENTKTNNQTSHNQNNQSKETAQPDLYPGWKTYGNTTYGISLRYPTEWKVDEGATDSSGSSTKQEFAINLKRNEDIKYNDTATIEVLNESISAATAWYDDYFAQSSSNTVSKTTNELKGKQSVQYKVTNAGVETRAYLFSVGNKTYLFTSINEELNAQTDSNYWTTFEKVFDSMQIK